MTQNRNLTPSLLAAGGVVTRRKHGQREFLVVHRPLYNDWSLPKGKLEYGERFLTAAEREIEEETGSIGRRIATLGSIAYKKGSQSKVARYWLFEHSDGKFKPNQFLMPLK